MLLRAARANRAFYAKLAKALSSKVFQQVVDLASGDVVQLVRTLPSPASPSVIFFLVNHLRAIVNPGILTEIPGGVASVLVLQERESVRS